MSGVKALRCGHCGAAFPLATLAQAIACPYCEHAVDVDRSVATEALAGELLQAMRRVESERQRADHWGGRVAAESRRAAASTSVVCPHCGAPNEYSPANRVQTCDYCSGALTPSKTMMVARLGLAEQAPRLTRLEHERSMRENLMRAHISNIEGPFPDAIGLPLVGTAMLVGSLSAVQLVGVFFQWLMGGEGTEPILIILIFMSAVVTVGPALIYLHLLRRRRIRAREALVPLARQFHGQASKWRKSIRAWLDQHWIAPFDYLDLFTGPLSGNITLDAWGYSGLAIVNPFALRGFMPNWRSPVGYVRLLFACAPLDPHAWARATLERGDPIAWRWLAEAGFTVSTVEGGLVVEAERRVVEHFRRHSDAVSGLAPVIGHAVRVLASVGARPVSASPLKPER